MGGLTAGACYPCSSRGVREPGQANIPERTPAVTHAVGAGDDVGLRGNGSGGGGGGGRPGDGGGRRSHCRRPHFVVSRASFGSACGCGARGSRG